MSIGLKKPGGMAFHWRLHHQPPRESAGSNGKQNAKRFIELMLVVGGGVDANFNGIEFSA